MSDTDKAMSRRFASARDQGPDSIAALRTAWVRALDAMEKRLGPEVTPDADYYWHLLVEEAFRDALSCRHGGVLRCR
jgi:hypothetical protein